MPKGDKYLGLKKYLQNSNEVKVMLTYKQIEEIINAKLPKSAHEHSESWWSNCHSHPQALSWLDAGFETDYVTETYEKKWIVFVNRK